MESHQISKFTRFSGIHLSPGGFGAAEIQMTAEEIKNEESQRDQVRAIVDMFFDEIRATFPAAIAAIRSQDDLNATKRVYFKGFVEHRINTLELLERGLKRARMQKTPFLPTVAQFAEWCQTLAPAEVFGISDVRTSYRNAVRYANEAFIGNRNIIKADIYIRLLSKKVGLSVLRDFSEKDSYPIFEHQYEVLLNRLRNGEDITADVPKAIPAPGETSYVPEAEEIRKAKAAALRSLLK
jgi:hypothetical protein